MTSAPTAGEPRATSRVDGGSAGGGVSLAVQDWGGNGPTLLLAHANGFHGHAWAPLARRLVDGGCRVVSFDFRGHGDSDPSPDGYAWAGFRDDVLTVVDGLGLGPNRAGAPTLIGVGHSKGGASLLLAEMARPGTFAGLWCFEPIVFPNETPREPNRALGIVDGARRRRDDWLSPEAAEDAYRRKPPLDVLDPEALRAYVVHGLAPGEDGLWHLKCRPDTEAEVFAHGLAHDAYAHLTDVHCPVVVAVGADTDALGPGPAGLVVDRLAHGRLEVMDGLGHFGPLQDPARVAAAILAFVGESAEPV